MEIMNDQRYVLSALIVWIIIVCVPVSAHAATYYVRNGGGTTGQCTGATNADYPGAGSARPCAYRNLQNAIDAATFGDTIKLRAGQTFSTSGVWHSFYLKDKGTPPTRTDADYITITSDDPSGTPSALSGYPANQTRITTAMAANMPKVQAVGAVPVFDFVKNSKYWKIERLNITNADMGVQCIVLFGQNDYAIKDRSEYPDHIVIQQNWIHPVEETGTPLDSTNLHRTAENAIYLNATNVTVRQNAIQGFVGRHKYGNAKGQSMTSSNYLITAWADNVLIENNLLEAWTYAFFSGGSRVGSHLVTKSGTVSACGPTSCVFSNTSGLQAGDPVAVYVSNAVPPRWGVAFVRSISGSAVTFTAPLCASYDGNNSCTRVSPAGVVPVNGNTARWDGYQPQNVTHRRNIFAHYPEWTAQLGKCGGKGYLEVKSCVNCVFDANIFTGCTGMTVTVRNQGGDFPWASLDGLTFSNNYFKNSNNTFLGFLTDSTPTRKSKNVTWTNNLMVGIEPVLTRGAPNGVLASSFYGGENATITHNTVLWTRNHHNFVSYVRSPMTGLTIKDNIFGAGVNYCWDMRERTTIGIKNCWPSAVVDHNILINTRGWGSNDLNTWWLTPFPNNTVVGGVASLGLVNFTSAESGGDYHGYALAAGSPFKGRASDGKDPGVDFDALDAVIFGAGRAAVPADRPAPAADPRQ